jgi:hypothetical protein
MVKGYTDGGMGEGMRETLVMAIFTGRVAEYTHLGMFMLEDLSTIRRTGKVKCGLRMEIDMRESGIWMI